MSTLIEQETGKLPADLTQVTTDVLKQYLAQQMETTAHHLVRMAAIWTELENRGEDLSGLRTGLTDYLPRIAAGELDASAVVQFAGNRQLLRYLATLPIERQRHLIEVGEIDLVLPQSGEPTRRKLAYLSGQEVTQVFGHGVVRSPSEQADLIASKKAARNATQSRPAVRPARLRYGTLELDNKRVTAGGKPVRAEDLLALLSEHYGTDLSKAVNN